MTGVILTVMKVAISLPDAVFRRIERAAKKLGLSRSELLARAAVEYLDELRSREVTASYDEGFGPAPEDRSTGPAEDALQREAARRALLNVEW